MTEAAENEVIVVEQPLPVFGKDTASDLTAPQPVELELELPGPDGTLHKRMVKFRQLDAKQVGEFQARFADKKGDRNTTAIASMKYRYVGMCLLNSDGKPWCSAEIEYEKLGKWSARLIEALFKGAMKVNPWGSENEVEQEAKN